MVEYKLTTLEEGKIDDTVNDIVMFIDKQYESIGVKDSLWVYDEEDEDVYDPMIYPTDLCEEIRIYLTDKLTELKGEE
tara:strand:- start:136 stop:369 length:234 start_codon:yes stop_codon:yes gene_type:complete